MDWLKSGLSIRQTAYAVSVVVVLTMAISSIEVTWAYRSERQRLISIMNQWFESVDDTSARAAYHIDQRQAITVLDGLIKFKTLAFAKITTDLGVILAERSRTIPSSLADPVATWFFGDIVRQQRALTFDRSTLVPSTQQSSRGTSLSHLWVGTIELNASPALAALRRSAQSYRSAGGYRVQSNGATGARTRRTRSRRHPNQRTARAHTGAA